MFHQPPSTEAEIAALPLIFDHISNQWGEVFTDHLISIWIQLAESGSLATLPPVPDIVGFANDCLTFFLIYHTNPDVLKQPPGTVHSASTEPESKDSSPPKHGSGKRWHPYPRPSSSTLRIASDEYKDEEAPGDQPPSDSSSSEYRDTQNSIGCVYLALSSATENTVDIGIALRPDARGRGYGRAALTKMIRYAFETLRMHRVAANVFGAGVGQSAAISRAMEKEAGTVCWIFEKIGFTPEGTQRRAGFSAVDGTWRDVHVLAMLDTDWVALERRTAGRDSIQSPWDTLMERHEKERALVVEWMEDPKWGRLKRSASTETIKGGGGEILASDTDESLIPDALRAPNGPAVVDVDSHVSPAPDSGSGYAETDSHDEEGPAFPAPSPAPLSSIGVSPPASIISLPSDFEWRSIDEALSSEPSAASTRSQSELSWQELSPRLANTQAHVPASIFSIDSEDERHSLWDDSSDAEMDDRESTTGLLRRQ